MPRPVGRQFFANPGPTNIPDSILRAIDRPSQDFMEPAFVRLVLDCRARLLPILGSTTAEVFFMTASGHGAWEASLVNLFSPGDRLLMLESGYFSDSWTEMARRFGLSVETVPADRRRGVDPAAVAAALRADTAHRIKAVCAVHNETSTGVTLPLAEIRSAIDSARHPALLLADTISSLGSLPVRMDDWGVDVVVGGSQKGLMLPTGLAFCAVSPRALAAHREARLPRFYMDWSIMLTRPHRSFVGTIPTQMFHGLAEALALIEAEGLDALYARHARLASAVRAAVRAWAANDGPCLYCTDPARHSDSVTAVLMPEGYDAEALRAHAASRYNVSLGGGLGPLSGRVFRIGHMGDLNEPMVLGTLAGGGAVLARPRRAARSRRGGGGDGGACLSRTSLLLAMETDGS
ncbi:MAG: aminotransferase class V-fold PLP-dependent enzyme [Acetobacteraceae bacterium]|nr:aminotransferase class V-fold PLP-dependent enzyme [Acetobacteraceae bacterium]